MMRELDAKESAALQIMGDGGVMATIRAKDGRTVRVVGCPGAGSLRRREDVTPRLKRAVAKQAALLALWERRRGI